MNLNHRRPRHVPSQDLEGPPPRSTSSSKNKERDPVHSWLFQKRFHAIHLLVLLTLSGCALVVSMVEYNKHNHNEFHNFVLSSLPFEDSSSTTTSSRGKSSSSAIQSNSEESPDLKARKNLYNYHAIEFFQNFMLTPPAPANVPYPTEGLDRDFYSQIGQDKRMDQILQQKRNGFFIEVGAYDGVAYSNSLFFEQSRGWTGLLIEANPRAYRELLAKDRKAYSTPACLAINKNVLIGATFFASGMDGAINEGVASSSAKQEDVYQYPVKANCFPLNVMLDAIGVSHVDMFSLDVEGHELAVLKTIDWSRITISLLTVEHNGKKKELDAFMIGELGYEKQYFQGHQDVMYLHKNATLGKGMEK